MTNGWNGYIEAMNEANEVYLKDAEAAWKLYQSEMNAVFSNPKINPQSGRVTFARAMARFWSRTERIGMALAAAEQGAFEGHIKPLRQQEQAPNPS